MGQTALPAPVRTVLSAIASHGTDRYPERVARRLRQTNIFNAIVFALYGLFAAFYAVLDWHVLWPLVMAIVATMPLFAIPPMMNRINDYAAMLSIAIINCAALVVYAYIIGTAAGLHYYLFAAPAAIVFFGPRHVRLAAAVSVCVLITFLLVDFMLPAYTSIAPVSAGVAKLIKSACVSGIVALIFVAVYLSIRLAENAEAALEREFNRSENLLLNLMPGSIALRLKNEPAEIIADHYEDVTILFVDIVSFTPRASRLPPREVVGFLNRVFSQFDRLAEKHRLEKIKTIGDAYMVAGGMPDQRTGHAVDVANMALDILDVTEGLSSELGEALDVRIGIHSGPVVAGVIGTQKLFYDVWGDTVNTAARMESHGVPGKIQVTEEAMRAIGGGFRFERRGIVDIKGKGPMVLQFLSGRLI